MKLKNLFFYMRYCNSRLAHDTKNFKQKITRTLQHHELIFITGGKGMITVDRKRYQVNEGMLVYICPDQLHSIENNADVPICFFSVHFDFAQVTFNESSWSINGMVEKLPLNSLQQLKDYYYIEDTFKKMVETWQAKLPGYEFAAKTLLQQLLLAIVQNIRKQNQNYATSTKVERVIQYIHQNSNHKVTLAELAAMVQLSPTYLSRVFKDITGYSLTEFLNRIKVDKAKELMSEGNMKVKEVAEAVGFNDEFYFSRIFKRIEGISPSEYYSKIVHGL